MKGFQTVPWNSASTKRNSSALQKCSTSGLKIRLFFHIFTKIHSCLLQKYACKMYDTGIMLTVVNDKKTSCHESVINLTQNELYEIQFSRYWVNYRKLTFATVVDIRNVTLFREKINAFSLQPKENQIVYFLSNVKVDDHIFSCSVVYYFAKPLFSSLVDI